MNLDKKYEENLYNDNLYKKGIILQSKIGLVKKIPLILFIILFIYDFIFVFSSYPKDGTGYNSDKIIMILISGFAILGVISTVISYCTKSVKNNFIKKYLILKYGDINYSTKKIKKMTSGDVYTEGSTRNKYNCIIEVPKYNFSIIRYQEQILKVKTSYPNVEDTRPIYSFTFETLKNVVEYRYSFFNIEKLSNIIRDKISNSVIIGNEIVVKREITDERTITICNELEIINKAESIYYQIKKIVEEGRENEV